MKIDNSHPFSGFHWLAGWLILAIVVIAFFPKPSITTQADIPKVGSIATRSYLAPITFDLPKQEQQLERERTEARKRVELVLAYSEDATLRILTEFEVLMGQIGKVGLLQAQIAKAGNAREIQQELQKLMDTLQTRLSPTAIHHLSLKASTRDAITSALQNALQKGVCELLVANSPRQVTLYQELHNLGDVKSILYGKPTLRLIRNTHEESFPVAALRTRETVIEESFSALQAQAIHSQGLQSAYYEVLFAFIQANIFYLEGETEKRRNIAAESVNASNGLVVRGMTILSAGMVVNQDAVDKLEALEIALQKEVRKSSVLTQELGRSLFLLLLVTLFFMNLRGNTHRLSQKQFWGITSIHILQVLLFAISFAIASALRKSAWILPLEIELLWLAPFVFAPTLNTILFGYRFGVISSLFVASYLGIQSSFDLVVFFIVLLVSLATSFSLRQVRYRSQFLSASLLGSGALLAMVFISLLLRNRLSWDEFWPPIAIGASLIFAILSTSSLFLVHLGEKLFGVTTNLTLMELSDFHHPLLKRLSERAPGSFHHSIMVGNLAEKAAVRIGADPLLTRVIALYHDIGKSERPEFFTENQKRGENPHDPLDPFESAAVIRNHVVKGLQLAAEYRIPKVISAGIPEHHGDNLIHYFFRKALQQKLDQEIPTEAFRYPGPRPQSRETALVMLADSIEAASRSMDEPDAYLLAKLVQDVIQTRLQEDQLRDSGLSIRDLDEIEIGFLQSLEGMYHTRIPYPDGVFISRRK